MGEGGTHSAMGLDPQAPSSWCHMGCGTVVQALSPRQGRDGEICARNSLSGSRMGMQALETPQTPILGDGTRTHLELISHRALRRNHQALEGLRMMRR